MPHRMKAGLAPVLGLLLAAMALFVAPGIASADFGTTPTPNGLTITTYTGSLEEFEADGEAADLVSAFATVDGEFVGYVFGAPDFVNDEFIDEFASGLESEGLIVRAGEGLPTTGNAGVDAVIEAVLRGNASDLAGLVSLQTVECTTSPGAGGPPQCEDGDPAGTEYEVIPLVTCEGEWIREEDLTTRLATMLDDVEGLYGVVQAGTDDLPDPWPSSDYYVVFHSTSGGQDVGIRFHVSDGDVEVVWRGCGATAADLARASGGAALPFVIGPFEN